MNDSFKCGGPSVTKSKCPACGKKHEVYRSGSHDWQPKKCYKCIGKEIVKVIKENDPLDMSNMWPELPKIDESMLDERSQELLKTKEMLNIAEKALEFYATSQHVDADMSVDGDPAPEHGENHWVLGKTARKALADMKKLNKN